MLYLKGLEDQDEGLVRQGFAWLEILTLTYWLCKESTKDFSKFFAQTVRYLCTQEAQGHQRLLQALKGNLLGRKPEEMQIANALKSSGGAKLSNDRAMLVLFTLELYRIQQKDEKHSLKCDYSLEHLMPQKWETHWTDIVGGNANKAEGLIYQVGNMVLLGQKLNTAISNNVWRVKVHGDQSKKMCLNSQKNHLDITKEVLEVAQWDADHIEKRTKSLTQEFLGIVRTLS
ncbi:hypothetical protein NHP21005_14080 [Helicobacter sp. NHP21005]|uniref:HNH endonuclease family protein n=1 Tax=Helicobacter felistomachi TaxID=3040201 RepID=UPI0025734193|nr:HNH endonuclease family protein [Helicobacter sp. NHP21005]BEG57720.1 hypothetical protein NHP21005_14080 [Helicobacter sp. NHP21005]